LNYGQATTPSGTFSQVSVGESHACAVRTDGTIACWGASRLAKGCTDIDGCGQSVPPAEGGFVEVLAAISHSLSATLGRGTAAAPAARVLVALAA
jgi:hypothetical protein